MPRKSLIWLLAGALLGLATTAWPQQTLSTRPQQGSEANRLWFRWLSVTHPELLPSGYELLAAERPIKCGTELLLQLHALRSSLSADQRQMLDEYATRPMLAHAIVSPNGWFRIHYDTDGLNAVSPKDDDQDGLPDFVQEAAKAFDRAYSIIVDSLGYDPPPSDGGVDGPEYDVYLIRFPGFYGETVLDRLLSSNPETYSSFIRTDNEFSAGSYYSPGLAGLRVTAAHEFFHMVHLGYAFRGQDIFYLEASSVWMEDIVYDDVNDYLQYLPGLFRTLNKSFNTTDGLHEYGLALWNKLLTKYWGSAEVVRDIWDSIRDMPAVAAISSVLQVRGSSFGDMLTEFSLWNYFTGPRARPQEFYEEGASYPDVTLATDSSVQADTSVVDSSVAASSIYYRFQVLAADQFSVTLEADAPFMWKYAVVVTNPGGQSQVLRFNPGGNGLLGRLESLANVVVIPTNTFSPEEPTDPFAISKKHRFSILLRRGAGGNGIVGNLSAPQPHPFVLDGQQSAVFGFELEEPGAVAVRILDASGRRVWDRDLGFRRDGFDVFQWDGRDEGGHLVDSGVYLLELIAPAGVLTEKFVVVRR